MAQLASALRSGRRGRVFESPLPDKKGSFTEPFLSGRGDSALLYPHPNLPHGEGLVASLREFVWSTFTEPFLSGRGDCSALLYPHPNLPHGEGLVASLREFVWITVTEPFLSGRGDSALLYPHPNLNYFPTNLSRGASCFSTA